MTASALLRTASVSLIVYATGNAMALLRFWRIADSMSPVHFPADSHALTYAQVVLGLGLAYSLSILLGAYLAWHLSSLTRTTPQAIGASGWVLFGYQLVVVWIGWEALSGLVFLFSIAIAVCIGWAAWMLMGKSSASAAAR